MNDVYIFIKFTKEELEDLMSNLNQCESEGYLNFGDPAYTAMIKINKSLSNLSN